MNSSSEEAEIVSVRDLSKSYGHNEVLRSINLSVNKGSVLGLIGLNGSGKTTTIECMLGLQNSDKGQISLLNRPASSIHETNGGIVGIFDTPNLHPNLTVRQSLEHAVLLCDKPIRKPSDVENLLGVEKFANKS